MPSLRVASYNVRVDIPEDGDDRWPHRRDEVGGLLREIDPDLVGIQETIAGQLRDLRERLPDHSLVGRSRGEEAGLDEYVPVSYRSDRFALADLSTYWLSETPDRPGSVGWDASHPRIATRAIVHDVAADEHVGFVVAHLDHEGERARREGADLLRSIVDEVDPDYPVVVVGDFNCVPGSPPYERLVAEATSARSLSAATNRADERVGPDGTFVGFDGSGDGAEIDHVFVTDGVAVRRYETRTDRRENGRYPSDHLPVVADLEY